MRGAHWVVDAAPGLVFLHFWARVRILPEAAVATTCYILAFFYVLLSPVLVKFSLLLLELILRERLASG